MVQRSRYDPPALAAGAGGGDDSGVGGIVRGDVEAMVKARIGGRAITVRGERKRLTDAKDLRANAPIGRSGIGDSTGLRPSTIPAPHYDSKWEERYARQLDTLKLAGEIVRWWYHPFSMWLPGKVRYKPDFMVQHHGHIQIVEVKGWSKNLRDGMTRLKVAAGTFTCYQWSLAKWNGRGFDITDVYGDEQ